jgi:hypothetical protein
MDTYTRRRIRLQELVDTRFSSSKVEFSKESGIALAYLSRLLNPNSTQPKRLGEDLARQIESRLRLAPGWLDDEGTAKAREAIALYGIAISREGVAVGAEWDKLQEPLRSQIQLLIETLVAKQVRTGRKKKDTQKESPRQPRSQA